MNELANGKKESRNQRRKEGRKRERKACKFKEENLNRGEKMNNLQIDKMK